MWVKTNRCLVCMKISGQIYNLNCNLSPMQHVFPFFSLDANWLKQKRKVFSVAFDRCYIIEKCNSITNREERNIYRVHTRQFTLVNDAVAVVCFAVLEERHIVYFRRVLSCQPRVTVTEYFVYNCKVNFNLYTPLKLTLIDISLVY